MMCKVTVLMSSSH